MKTRTLWMGAAVLVLAVACNRNDTQSTSGAPQETGQQASTITLTGCLQSGEQGLAPDQARSPENVDRFVLSNAKAPASASDTSTGPLYILDGKNDELRQHLSHQVEVTGKLNDSSSPGDVRRLEVDSVRMIASTCSN